MSLGALPFSSALRGGTPVLPEVVGKELAVRVVVPSALAQVPKVKAIVQHIRAFTGEL